MITGHHDDDCQQAGERQRAGPQPRPPEPATAAHLEGVDVARDPIGVDRRNDPVNERDEVEELDEDEESGNLADELQGTHPDGDAGGQGRDQDRRRGEAQGPLVRAGVRVSQTRKQEREERRRERRPTARLRCLLGGHRRVG